MAKKPKKPKEPSLKTPPEEFEAIRLEPKKDVFDQAIDVQNAGKKIRRALEEAKARIGNQGHILVHEYAPSPEKNFFGEVDGEWRIDGIRGESTKELLHEMLEAILPYDVRPGQRSIELGDGYWITVGTRFHGKSEFNDKTGNWDIDPNEDHYRRHEGMLEVSSNYRRTSSPRVLSAFNAILERSSRNKNPMWKNIEKKFRHKISQVFVRINWNPTNVQPKR